jgi:7 transmembrane receptor (rhodopsin family)
MPAWQTVTFGVMAAVVSALTVGGNLVVVTAFVIERNIRHPSNYFIASLAVSDLLIGAVSMPLYTVYLATQHIYTWPLYTVYLLTGYSSRLPGRSTRSTWPLNTSIPGRSTRSTCCPTITGHWARSCVTSGCPSTTRPVCVRYTRCSVLRRTDSVQSWPPLSTASGERNGR